MCVCVCFKNSANPELNHGGFHVLFPYVKIYISVGFFSFVISFNYLDIVTNKIAKILPMPLLFLLFRSTLIWQVIFHDLLHHMPLWGQKIT